MRIIYSLNEYFFAFLHIYCKFVQEYRFKSIELGANFFVHPLEIPFKPFHVLQGAISRLR